MKIIIINGSPKGKNSITLQHIHYIAKEYPGHELEVFNIGSGIAKIEKDTAMFHEICEKISGADAMIWSFPVYYALVPSQMKRFIELLFERCNPGLFNGKYATSITTSINFFDHTAHNYVQGISEELGFSYVKGYSANMNDFFDSVRREKIVRFYRWFIQMAEKGTEVTRKYNIQIPAPVAYEPKDIEQRDITHDQKLLLLTDETKEDGNLSKMTDVFEKFCSMPVIRKNIRDIGMKNGCIGCCTCGYDNTCVQKDGYQEFYDNNVRDADIIIIAGSIRDHYLSSVWKCFFDRSFFNGHAPVLMGKRIGFIISGPLSRIQNLRESLEALGEIWHMKTSCIVTDECRKSEEITSQIRAFATQLELAVDQDLEFGAGFYRIAGSKLFRDFIYLSHAVFRADHIFYKKAGFYKDFPQRNVKKRLGNRIFSFFMRPGFIRKEIHKKFIPQMVAPYKKILNQN